MKWLPYSNIPEDAVAILFLENTRKKERSEGCYITLTRQDICDSDRLCGMRGHAILWLHGEMDAEDRMALMPMVATRRPL